MRLRFSAHCYAAVPMPELAEVEYYRKIWDPGLGSKILRVHLHPRARVFRGEPAESLPAALTGATFQASHAHGKQMLFAFSRRIWLGGHLGMSGEMLCLPPDHAPGKHDHLILFTRTAALTFRDPRMFGRLRIHEGKSPPAWWSDMPPAAGSSNFTPAQVRTALTRHPRLPLKTLLLDQRYFPGIGNWMADEILWQLRGAPATPAGSLPPSAHTHLHRTLQKISRHALATIGQTWADPPASWLFLHRWRDGGHCPRCSTPLTRADLLGRTCCWCPDCQG